MAQRQNLDLKAGELIVFSEGIYSDYGYSGSYVVLQDVSEKEIKELEKSINNKKDSAFCTDSWFEFESACIKKGWLAQINLREIHLGSYSLELDEC